MTSSFVRTLWGIYDHKGRRFFQRRKKMDTDIELLLNNQYSQQCRTYVFGKDNYKYLTNDVGLEDCVLVDKRPIVWDMDTQQFRHKLEAFRLGMEDFDQIVFLDWDCQPIAPIPDDFWEKLGEKGSFQAILRMYHRRKAYWRNGNQRKIPCASFVYFDDKKIPNDLIALWEEMNCPWSEEIVMGKYMDDLMGGFTLDKYWETFEPDFFILGEGRVFSHEQLATKNHCFNHFNSKMVHRELAKIKKQKKKQNG